MPKRILLADDSITIQKVVELTFSDGDYEIISTNNGSKAIQKLSEVRPDIILSDIIMPEKNGYEVCEYVKSHPDFRNIPVILLTGTFEPFDPDRAEKAGCDAVVTKPFESQSLVSKVEELIRARSTDSGATAAQTGEEVDPESEQAVPWRIPSFSGFDESADKSDLDSAPAEESPFAGSWSAEPKAPLELQTESSEAAFTPEPESGDEPSRPVRSFELDSDDSAPGTEMREEMAKELAAGNQVEPPEASAEKGPWAFDEPERMEESADRRTLQFPRRGDEWQTEAPSEFGEPGETEDEASQPFESPGSDESEPEPLAESAGMDQVPESESQAGEQPPSTDPWAAQESADAQGEPAQLSWQPIPEEREETPAAGEDPSMAETTMWPTPEAEAEAAAAAESEDKPAADLGWRAPEPAVEGTIQASVDQDMGPSSGEAEELLPQSATGEDPSTATSSRLSDEDVERIARKVVELMSDTAVRNIAWEVIPEMAEMIVRERIRQLEKE